MPKAIPSKSQKAKGFSLLILFLLAGAFGWRYWQKEKAEGLANGLTSVVLERFQEQRPMMGTLAVVTVYAPSEEKAQSAIEEAFQRGAAINQVASDYLPDSELTRFNSHVTESWFPASEDLLTMVAYGLELAELTLGAYDPTLGTMSHLWRETQKGERLPTIETLDQVRASSGWESLEIDLAGSRLRKSNAGMRLDLGGIAKGYAGDQMLAVFEKYGMKSALVVIGGDVRCGAAPPQKAGWTVGLQDHHSQLVGTMTMANCAVSTSGDFEQFIEIGDRRYSHVIDPATGLGTTDSLLATVVAPNGLMADSLATAACVNPSFFEELSPSTHIHSRILSLEKRQVSPGFPALAPISSRGQNAGEESPLAQ